MSVIIDDMDMPDNCVSCPFCIGNWYQDFKICVANKGRAIKVNLNTGYDDSCPMRAYEVINGIYRVKYERLKGKVEAIRTRCTPGAEEYFDKNQLGLLKIVTINNDNVLWQKLFNLQYKLDRIGGILSEPDRKGTDGAVESEKSGRDAAGGNQETV